MNKLRNRVQLIGNLGNAPDARTTETGKKLVRFSVATNEVYTGRTGRKETATTWHNIIAWGNLAEIAEKFLVKGKEVCIEGKLVNRNYVDKDGITRYVSEVQAVELLMIGSEKKAV
jgi:single-strand DNA-binding protein